MSKNDCPFNLKFRFWYTVYIFVEFYTQVFVNVERKNPFTYKFNKKKYAIFRFLPCERDTNNRYGPHILT